MTLDDSTAEMASVPPVALCRSATDRADRAAAASDSAVASCIDSGAICWSVMVPAWPVWLMPLCAR